MNQDNTISAIVTLATGMIVVLGIGYFINQMIPRRIPAKVSQAMDIKKKTIKELLESGMTLEELICSVWRAEEELRK